MQWEQPAMPRRARAQALVEYALIISLVAITAIASMTRLGLSMVTLLSNLGGSV